jgi:hypothetical protein
VDEASSGDNELGAILCTPPKVIRDRDTRGCSSETQESTREQGSSMVKENTLSQY